MLYFKHEIKICYQILEQCMNWAVLQLLATLNLLIPDMFTGFMKSSALFQMVGLTLSFSHSPYMHMLDSNPPHPDRQKDGIWERAEVLNYTDYCAKHRKLKPINSL